MTEDAEEQDRQRGIGVLLFTLTAVWGCGIVITVKKKYDQELRMAVFSGGKRWKGCFITDLTVDKAWHFH